MGINIQQHVHVAVNVHIFAVELPLIRTGHTVGGSPCHGLSLNLPAIRSVCWSAVPLFLLFSFQTVAQQPVINEMMASNSSSVQDADGDHSDWLEIYNPSAEPYSLAGHFLSDRADNLTMWAFPDTVIAPHAFMVVFASNKDRAVAGEELHTNFAISASGEELFLTDDGTVIHHVPETPLATDISFGLQTDGNGPFVVFSTPTPGASNNLGQVLVQLQVNVEGGFHAGAFDLTFTGSPPVADIRYTTDGTTPTAASTLYESPLTMSGGLVSTADIHQVQISLPDLHYPSDPDDVPKAIVIRAAAFDTDGQQVSDVITHSYFIHALTPDHAELPVLSICADHGSLFDPDTGIFVPGVHWDSSDPLWTGNYYQRGSDWERDVHVEFYENPTNAGFRQNAGLRTHGGNSRRFTQKGLRLYARSDYGTSRFNHALFPEKPIASFKRLVVRPFMSSWSGAGTEDVLAHRTAMPTGAEALGTRPVILYVNGEYWGIYFLQERLDHRYIGDNHGLDPDDVDMVENWAGLVAQGQNSDFLALYSFIEQHDLADAANYEVVEGWMDIDNFIDYQLLEIFLANYDWPDNNMKCWRDRNPGGKWRWVFFDGDAGFQNCGFDGFGHALDTAGQGWPTNPQATLFLRRLMENDSFADRFFDRLEQLLNTHFSTDAVTPEHEVVLTAIAGEVDRQVARFAFPADHSQWTEATLSTGDFIECRPCEMVMQTLQQFGRAIDVEGCMPVPLHGPKLNGGLRPNPNNGQFDMNYWSDIAGTADVSIVDLTGRRLAGFTVHITPGDNLIRTDLPDLPSGLLLLTVSGPQRTVAYRFVKL